MRYDLAKIVIFLGVVLTLSFTLFAAVLSVYFDPYSTTTTTTSTTTSSLSSTSSTTTSTTTSSTSSTTTPLQCGLNSDCGDEYYSGTYFCNKDEISLLRCKPRCVLGVCKERCEIEPLRVCRSSRNQTCVPGRKECLQTNEFENVTSFLEVYPGEYSKAYNNYQFRLSYVEYKGYEVRSILLDVKDPDGEEDQIIATWDLPTVVDDFRIGLYSVKKSSAAIWLDNI